jgi:LysM repeat protein
MNSIRPLVTITILVVVGAYLYVKINEGPEQPEGADAWQNETLDDVPPLETVAADTAESNAAPTVAMEPAANVSGASPLAPATSDVSTNSGAAPGTLPGVPAIPDLPAMPVGQGDFATPAATHSTPIPNELPQNIPVAQYPDGPSENTAAASYPGGGSSAVQQYQAALDQASVPFPATQDVTGTTPNNGLSTAPTVPPEESQQPPVTVNPLRQSAPATTQADPYTNSVYGQPQSPAPAGTTPPVTATFTASLPAIQMALDRRELARALELLTPWHHDPSLSPAEAEQVETLLGQLAGTVVYSTEHQLEPARVVKSGETLETIAKEYNVPWRLLAKINGIPAADQVRPGQELKVVRGPFSADVDLNRKELTLAVNGRYAGKFPVTGTSSAAVPEGDWVVAGANTGTPSFVILTRPNASAAEAVRETVALGPVDVAERVGVSTAAVGLSKLDTNEVADILSVGSRVVIRR